MLNVPFKSYHCYKGVILFSASLGGTYWIGVSPAAGLWNDGSTISSADFPSLAASTDCGGMISGVDGTLSPVDDCTQHMKVLCMSKCHNRCYCLESSALDLPTLGKKKSNIHESVSKLSIPTFAKARVSQLSWLPVKTRI